MLGLAISIFQEDLKPFSKMNKHWQTEHRTGKCYVWTQAEKYRLRNGSCYCLGKHIIALGKILKVKEKFISLLLLPWGEIFYITDITVIKYIMVSDEVINSILSIFILIGETLIMSA